MKHFLTLLFCFIFFLSYSQDGIFLKVHFLYGSKPLKRDKNTEQKWFGGILGGHVGIEVKEDKVLNFLPSREFFYLLLKVKIKKYLVFVGQRLAFNLLISKLDLFRII